MIILSSIYCIRYFETGNSKVSEQSPHFNNTFLFVIISSAENKMFNLVTVTILLFVHCNDIFMKWRQVLFAISHLQLNLSYRASAILNFQWGMSLFRFTLSFQSKYFCDMIKNISVIVAIHNKYSNIKPIFKCHWYFNENI